MKRWFSSSKTYELSADQSQQKSSKDRQAKLGSDLSNSKVTGDEKTAGSTAEPDGETATVVPVAISLKETTVESSRKSHRRQKSSGNWKMLLGDAALPSQTPSEELGKNTNSSNSLVDDTLASSLQPVRLPVSSKEARPLSFFKNISADESVRHVDAKPKRSEIFPWGGSQTPSPSSENSIPAAERSVDSSTKENGGDGKLFLSALAGDRKLKQSEYKSRLSRISQSLEDSSPSTETPSSTRLSNSVTPDILQELPVDALECNMSNLSNDTEEPDTERRDDSSDNCSVVRKESITDDEITIPSPVSIAKGYMADDVTDNNDGIDSDSHDGDSIEAGSTLPFTRAIHELENEHVKRNSDPCSVKRRRKHSQSKRRSFPQSLDDSHDIDLSEAADVDMDVKCAILKISAVEAETTLEKETFVLIDPAVEKLEAHGRKISLKSFTGIVPEQSDMESEQYRLAETMGETLVDTTSEESTSASDHPMDTNPNELPDKHFLKFPEEIRSEKFGLRKSSMFKSNTELSSLTGRSLDEASAGGSEKGSLHSFKSSLSNKSYSVNDLTLLERPSGFGTLDMNKLVGSFQMLDSIISEHAVQTRKYDQNQISQVWMLQTTPQLSV